MPHPETKIGTFEFGREQITRTIEIEKYCNEAKAKMPEAFKLFYPYLQIHEYVNARIDLIKDRSDAWAWGSKEAMTRRINNNAVLDLLDEIINNAYGIMQ